jgi:hypothetical protein
MRVVDAINGHLTATSKDSLEIKIGVKRWGSGKIFL